MKEPRLGFNRNQSFLEFETTEGKMIFGKEDNRIFVEVLGSKFYLTDTDGSSPLGDSPSSIGRTYSPIVALNDINANIDALAVAPGAGTNWWSAGGTNTIALVYMDAHYVTDRNGSLNEINDI